MENLKIRVNSEAESREVQELFFKLGYKWNLHKGHYDIESYPNIIRSHETGEMTQSISSEALYKRNKEITLPQLRAMANQDQDEPFLTPECTLNDQYAEIEQVRQDEMKEYLIPSANYKYQKAYPITSWRDWVEIPNGAEWAKLWDKGESYECVEFYRGENEFFNNSSKKWMRGADQRTNKIGQPATIIWNRHASSVAAKEKCSTPSSAWDVQVGGDHYKQFQIQPMQFALENKLDAAQQNVIKYIMRHSFKNGKQDLEKAKHYIDLMIEFYYGENNNG